MFLIALGLWLGCSETNLVAIEKAAATDIGPAVDTGDFADTAWPASDPDPDSGPPRVGSSVDSIDPGIICGNFEREILVLSQGETPLDISEIRVIGEGWSLSHDTLPIRLEPGERFPVQVASRGGVATMVVLNSDPGRPALEIPMAVVADAPPSVVITSPGGGEVLSPGADTVISAMVTDDVDMSPDLALEWSSDIDGILSTAPASADGVAEVAWGEDSRSSGEHIVSLNVVDSCMQSQRATVSFCQNEGYTEDSIDLASWNFEGSALWDADNGWIELTAPAADQAGTAFQTTATVSSDEVDIHFLFYVSGGSGADGMSLTALDADRMSSFVGGTGGGIGYVGLPGWSIEIDTWYNSIHSDPTTADHISVHIDGDVGSPLVWAELPEMEDGAWHEAAVSVVSNHMTVSIDGVVYIDVTIPELYPFDAYIGFTAATGAATNYHLVDALEVEAFVCDD
jgi:hypothetical protein